jgi:hypothetical protein
VASPSPFVDPTSGETCYLVFRPGTVPGVSHLDCDQLGDVSVAYDAWYCPPCGKQGRVSGAWCINELAKAGGSPLWT